MTKVKINKILILSVCLLVMSTSTRADSVGVFNLWVPAAYSQALTISRLAPFRKVLEARLERPVKVQVYNDLDSFLEQCRQDKVDHVLLDKIQAVKVMKQCHFQLLAKASQPIYLYTTRDSGKYHFSELRSIGLHTASSAAQLIKKELDPTGRRFSLQAKTNLVDALSDLLQHRIDGLVTLHGLIAKLDSRINSKLRVVYRFQTPQTVYFLGSSTLDSRTVNHLETLYLVKNKEVNGLLDEQFGLGKLEAVTNEELTAFHKEDRKKRDRGCSDAEFKTQGNPC